MSRHIIAPLLLLSALWFGACASTGSSSTSGHDIGIVAGAILGGIAGAQMGDGDNGNIIAGAVIGGALGRAAGTSIDKQREELEAAEAQRQYDYEQEVAAQNKLEGEMKALEAQKVRDEIARNATSSDVAAAEREAARIEAELAAKIRAHEESQERARRIQEAQERIAKAQEELAELERLENRQ